MRQLRKGPLFAAVAIPVLFALFGGALIGGNGVGWFAKLDKPRSSYRCGRFNLVGLGYYAGCAAVPYRILDYVHDRRGEIVSLAPIIIVMLLNELWNYLFFGLRSTLAGFLGIVVFLMPLTALVLVLRRYEWLSARLVTTYYLWVLYDLAWTYQLWRLIGD